MYNQRMNSAINMIDRDAEMLKPRVRARPSAVVGEATHYFGTAASPVDLISSAPNFSKIDLAFFYTAESSAWTEISVFPLLIFPS